MAFASQEPHTDRDIKHLKLYSVYYHFALSYNKLTSVIDKYIRILTTLADPLESSGDYPYRPIFQFINRAFINSIINRDKNLFFNID